MLPGSVDTPILRASAAQMIPNNRQASIDAWGQAHPIGRIVTAEETAELVLFLCSSRARALTDAAHILHSGLTARLSVSLKD